MAEIVGLGFWVTSGDDGGGCPADDDFDGGGLAGCDTFSSNSINSVCRLSAISCLLSASAFIDSKSRLICSNRSCSSSGLTFLLPSERVIGLVMAQDRHALIPI